MSHSAIGTFLLNDGAPGHIGANISLKYDNSSEIQLYVSTRDKRDVVNPSNAEPITNGNGVSLEIINKGGLEYLVVKKAKPSDVPGTYKNNTFVVGGGSQSNFDGKIGLNVKALNSSGEVAFVGANDARDSAVGSADCTISPMTVGGSAIYLFWNNGLIVHRDGAFPVEGNESFTDMNIPRWARLFNISH